MGGSYLQLWVPFLGYPIKSLDSKIASREVYGWNAYSMEHPCHCSYWSQELCWNFGLKIPIGHGRSRR